MKDYRSSIRAAKGRGLTSAPCDCAITSSPCNPRVVPLIDWRIVKSDWRRDGRIRLGSGGRCEGFGDVLY